jgi:Recombination endonuclease VII
MAHKDPEKHREATRKWYVANREKKCEAARKRYAANPEKYRVASRKYRTENPEKSREAQREATRKWRAENPEKHREAKRKRNYGPAVTFLPDDYRQQPCPICGSADPKALVVDHCHTSGRIRAPICHGCNVAIGYAKDNPTTLRAAADYLERQAEFERLAPLLNLTINQLAADPRNTRATKEANQSDLLKHPTGSR